MIKDSIVTDVGIICSLLFDKGTLSIKEIETLTGIDPLDLRLSLGWLARENKVCFSEENDTVYVELINEPQNME